MLKKLLFFIVLYCLSVGSFKIASAEIIPLKKPLQTKEETEKKLLIDILKPLPKPVKKNETKPLKEKIIVKKEKKSGFVLPKKKPLIVGSEKTTNRKIFLGSRV